MADISVSLGLDDREYTTKIKAAENASKSFASATTAALNSAKSGFAGMVSSIDNLNSKFSGLSRAVAGIGMTALVTDLIKGADALVDMANGVGVSTAKLMELGAAAAASGSSIEGMNNMLFKLNDAAGNAAAGNDKAIQSFNKLGISMNDLTTKSPDEVFLMTAKSLAAIEDPATRTALAMDLYGKASKGVDWKGIVAGAGELSGKFDSLAEAQKKAADFADQLGGFIMKVKAELLNMISPVIDVASALLKMADGMGGAKIAAGLLLAAMVLVTGSGIVSGFTGLVSIITTLAGAFGVSTAASVAESAALVANTAAIGVNTAARAAGLAAKVASLSASLAEATARAAEVAGLGAEAAAKATVEKLTWRLAVAQGALAEATVLAGGAAGTAAVAVGATAAPMAAAGVASAGAATGFGAAAAGLLALLAPIAAAVAAAGSLYAVWQALWGENGITKGGSGENFISKFASSTWDSVKAMTGLGEQTKTVKTEAEKMAPTAAKTAVVVDQITKGFRDQVVAIRETNLAMEGGLKAMTDRVTKQWEIVNASKADQEVTMANFDAQAKAQQDIASVNAKIAEARIKLNEEIRKSEEAITAKKRAGEDTTEIEKEGSARVNAAKAVINEYEKQKQIIQQTADVAAGLKKLELERQGVLETQNQVLENQRKAKSITNDLEKESAQMTMSSNQKRISDIDYMIKAEQEAAVKAFEDATKRKATAAEALAINNKVAESYVGIKEKAQQVIDQSQSFSTGWGKALNDYKQQAGDAATVGSDLFKQGTKGMEDALINFAKTGKMEWGTLLSDMLEKLARWGIQSAFSAIMDSLAGGSGFGGLWDKVKGLFGGGSSSGSSGSSGGGILSSIVDGVSSLFGGGSKSGESGNKGGGNIISNIWDGVTSLFGGGSGSSTSGTSSSDSRNLYSNDGYGDSYYDPNYAGAYAGGGLIPVGKYGIAGEAGAELISGPAQVTPLDQLGGTNVTYNINAVDAQSFRQMVARDPSFLYAVTEQGRKSIPGAR